MEGEMGAGFLLWSLFHRDTDLFELPSDDLRGGSGGTRGESDLFAVEHCGYGRGAKSTGQ